MKIDDQSISLGISVEENFNGTNIKQKLEMNENNFTLELFDHPIHFKNCSDFDILNIINMVTNLNTNEKYWPELKKQLDLFDSSNINQYGNHGMVNFKDLFDYTQNITEEWIDLHYKIHFRNQKIDEVLNV